MRRIVTTDKKGKKKLVNVPSWDLTYVNNQFGQPAYDIGISSNGSGSAASSTGSDLIYTSLSAAGQTAFNATAVGNFFTASAVDYASVFANVTGATKYGMNDSQLAEVADGWSGGYAFTLQASLSTIPANSYVIGYAARASTGPSGTITAYISTTFTGSYSAIANSPTFLGNQSALQYYIRRNPQTATAATSYLALGASITRIRSQINYNGFYAQSPFNSWTNYAGARAPVQQFMSTTTKAWN
jgi:hypothetical protein